ncbi:low molecular weight protein-tyrosine-phosphatase [Rhizobium chutanense]|uniref:protein-tyrosine-phosphatase n=1 Tax=Rhizobium chutanense TaxID=2035448 RepID=A0A432PA23_9HYPH|nr:low molecular weight protein-tyrosine-phosphatase [Rhizobium chutanense]RUM09866.1 low molecular weight phosphotyrosine protein phosphatase [Rhizobium chutanense]
MKRISILFVCMGNICRSPLAEGIFRHLVAKAGLIGHFRIDSAATGGWHEGDPPDRRSVATAKSHGIDISGQRARRIQPRDFTDFDLILAMDRDNVAALRKIAPPEADIRLFGDIALGTGEDIPDPYYGGPTIEIGGGFERVYTRLFTGCSSLLETLGVERASCSGNTSSVR